MPTEVRASGDLKEGFHVLPPSCRFWKNLTKKEASFEIKESPKRLGEGGPSNQR